MLDVVVFFWFYFSCITPSFFLTRTSVLEPALTLFYTNLFQYAVFHPRVVTYKGKMHCSGVSVQL